MAKISNDNVFVNIKELPQVGGIESGDLLVVETEDGTNIIDFDDIIIDTYQTTFYSVLTANDLALDNSIVEIEQDLADLTVTVDQLGGSTFNALSAQINSNTASITALNVRTTASEGDITNLNTRVTTISAAQASSGIKAYGFLNLTSGGSPNYVVSFANYGPSLNILRYEYVRRVSSIPIVGSISPSVRIWNIFFTPFVEVDYVDVQLGGLAYSGARRVWVSAPALSANNTWYVSVSTQGPDTSGADKDFKVRFSAF
jgi:hypothetical protein